MEVIEYIKSDLYRCYGKCDFLTFIKGFFLNKGFNYMFHLRCVQHGRILKLLSLVPYYLKRNFGSINIGRKCKIGYGLYLGHNGPVIINDNAVLGNNINLSQFVTIGSNDEKAAIIENEVYIGPSVCVVGDVHIGAKATIGAGAIVVKDVPENGTCVGNPGKVINTDSDARFILNKWGCRS